MPKYRWRHLWLECISELRFLSLFMMDELPRTIIHVRSGSVLRPRYLISSSKMQRISSVASHGDRTSRNPFLRAVGHHKRRLRDSILLSTESAVGNHSTALSPTTATRAPAAA